MQDNEHGGNIYRFMELMNCKIEQIIDFSASINPLGVPKTVIEKIRDNIKYLCHYPDPDIKYLAHELSRHLDIDPHNILCGNGSTELIYLIVRALKPEKVLIPIPTFSEYERACKTIGSKLNVQGLRLKREDNFDVSSDEFIQNMKGCKMAFLCNPNNPTGRLMKKEDVLKIADAARDLKCYLIVDEAFMDFVPEESVVREVQNNPYLIVLRSMTKFYALAGIRIGYGVFHQNIIDTIKRQKEPWTVNTIAQIAGIAALRDKDYKKQTFKIIQKEKKVFEDSFRLLNINYFPSSANFYLIRHEKAQEIIPSLKNKGIMVRDCSNFNGLDSTYMRIAVRSKKENIRLLEELTEICQAL